jgi:hypothetical protein
MQSQDLILAKARGKILELINPWQNQYKWLCFNADKIYRRSFQRKH